MAKNYSQPSAKVSL